MRAYLYCRIASPQEEPIFMEVQRWQLMHFAKTRDWQIVGQTLEYAAGANLTRPGLQEVDNAVRAGQVAVVIVHDLSRISRHMVLIHEYSRFLHQHNVALLSVSEGIELKPHDDRTPCLALDKKSECSYRSFQLL